MKSSLSIVLLLVVACNARMVQVFHDEPAAIVDCGAPDAPMKFTDVSIKPDPVMWPGNATVAGVLTVKKQLPTKKFRIKTTIKKLTPFEFTVPCVKQLAFGSCDFDVCEYLLPTYKDTFCDKAGICSCPVKPGTYSAKNFVQPLPSGVLAGLVIGGKYEGKGVFIDENEKEWGCIKTSFTIKKVDGYDWWNGEW